MGFRMALVAVTVSSLLGATAALSEGKTVLAGPVSKTVTGNCLPVVMTRTFYAGDYIQIGTAPHVETRQIMYVYHDQAECGQGPRYPNVGSFKLDSPPTRAYDTGAPVLDLGQGSGTPSCFPGDATVNVYGQGTTHMSSLSVGDRVLVGSGDFTPILSFLHKVPGMSKALTVQHAQGALRASENHIVFAVSGGVRQDMPVSSLRPGDELLVRSADGEEMRSVIVGTGQEKAFGMYAPFTSSGSLVVDGVIASNYGTPASGTSLPHAAAHAAFFTLRVYHYVDLGMVRVLLGLTAVIAMFQHLRLYK